MTKRSCVLPLILAVACAPAHSALRSVQGEARDPASGDLLYVEEHLIRGSVERPLERLVLYRCVDGTAFARKQVDYRTSATAPAFSLMDARNGYREGLRRDGRRTLVWGGTAATGHHATPVAARPGTPLVADAGFDAFLRGQWSPLLAGGSPVLAFVVPSMGRSIEFRLERIGEGRIGGAAVERFRLKPGGLLGLVGPGMEVAYDASDRQLRRFTGLTNLRDDRGRPLRARIDFPGPSRTAREGDWIAGLAAPLSGCRVGK